jgi:putative addiction module CopG family antidote
MADRQTMNVSLPPTMEQFVRAQVASGRYRSASEVLREGIRLLEEAEQRRLLEKWLYDGLSTDEESQLPQEFKDRVRDHFAKMVEDGIRSGDETGWVDGPATMDRLAAKLRTRFKQEP